MHNPEPTQKPLQCKQYETVLHIPLVEEFETLMETGVCLECNVENYATEEGMKEVECPKCEGYGYQDKKCESHDCQNCSEWMASVCGPCKECDGTGEVIS